MRTTHLFALIVLATLSGCANRPLTVVSGLNWDVTLSGVAGVSFSDERGEFFGRFFDVNGASVSDLADMRLFLSTNFSSTATSSSGQSLAGLAHLRIMGVEPFQLQANSSALSMPGGLTLDQAWSGYNAVLRPDGSWRITIVGKCRYESRTGTPVAPAYGDYATDGLFAGADDIPAWFGVRDFTLILFTATPSSPAHFRMEISPGPTITGEATASGGAIVHSP